jgi:hypothetical protein
MKLSNLRRRNHFISRFTPQIAIVTKSLTALCGEGKKTSAQANAGGQCSRTAERFRRLQLHLAILTQHLFIHPYTPARLHSYWQSQWRGRFLSTLFGV